MLLGLTATVQCVKILLVPQNAKWLWCYLIINCDSNIRLFYIARCKNIALNLVCFILEKKSLLYSFMSLYSYRSSYYRDNDIFCSFSLLKAIAINFSLSPLTLKRAIIKSNNIRRAIQNRNHESINKKEKKSKEIKSDNFFFFLLIEQPLTTA